MPRPTFTMISVPITMDVRKYEVKFLGPFNKKQTICLGITGLLGLIPFAVKPLHIYVKLGILTVLLILGFFAGTIKIAEMPFEVLIIRLLLLNVLGKPKRALKTTNEYSKLRTDIKKMQEKERINKMTPAQKKKYKKEKGTIVRSQKYKQY